MRKLLVVLLILTAIILIPPIRYGYIYPNQGDDTATHIMYFMNMDRPSDSYYEGAPELPIYPLYVGQYIIGRLLNALPFNMVITFNWFNIFALILAVWCVGLSIGLAANPLSGILASILVFGRSYLLMLYYWGTIFDIIGIAVLLPILLLCLHNMDKGKPWVIGIILTLPLFAVFHANGRIVYGLIPLVIVCEGLRYLCKAKGKMLYANWVKDNRIFIYLCVLSLALFVLFLMKFGVDYSRLLGDATILLMMLGAGIVGKLMSGIKPLMRLSIVMVAVAVAFPGVSQWVQYNNALREVDKQAIAYVNGLEGKTYEVSPEVSVNIYRLYVDKRLSRTPDYLITRSVPMTETSAIAVKNGTKPFVVDGYRQVAKFMDGEVDYNGKPIWVAIYAR